MPALLRWPLGVLTCLIFALSASAGAAQTRGRSIDGVRFDAHLDLAWHSAFGLGFRVDIPVADDVVDGVHDELAISPGAELFFFNYNDYCHRHGGSSHCHDDSGGVGLWPLVALQWNFYINQYWSVFPELGLSLILFDDGFGNRHGHDRDFFIYPFLGVGGRYHFSARNALLMRINWPAGLQIGITF